MAMVIRSKYLQQGLKPVRCYSCEKVLGMIDGKAEIKCPRCRALNIIDTKYKRIHLE